MMFKITSDDDERGLMKQNDDDVDEDVRDESG